jgi:transposase
MVNDAHGMPLHCTVTAANGDERMQVIPLLDGIILEGIQHKIRVKRLKKIACDKGYDDKKLRDSLRKRGIKPEIPKRQWKGKKQRGRPMIKTIPRYKVERTFSWFQRKYRRITTRWERIAVCFIVLCLCNFP